MVRLPDSSDCKIQFLVDRRFPTLRRRQASRVNLRRSAGDFTELNSRADQYRRELLAKSGPELDNLYKAEWASSAKEALERAEREEAARPYNQPLARANFSYWAKMSYWTPDEAVALSLGRNPRVANWPAVQQLVSVSRFASEYASRREIVLRAKTMGQLRDFTIPSVFLAWAERMEIPLPGNLAEAVRSLGTQVADWKSLYERQKEIVDAAEQKCREIKELHADSSRKHSAFMREMSERQDKLVSGYTAMIDQQASKIEYLQSQIDQQRNGNSGAIVSELGARERDSLLRLTIGMAIGGYGHDPNAKRTDTVSTIATDLHEVGLSLSDDTIRKYLAEGRELLPRYQSEYPPITEFGLGLTEFGHIADHPS